MSIHYKLCTLFLSTFFMAFALSASAQKYDYVIDADDNEDVVIYIDGERQGSCPRRISVKFNEKQGIVSHKLELKKKGYKTWTMELTKPETHKLVKIKGTMVKDIKTIPSANKSPLKIDKVVFGLDDGTVYGKRTSDGTQELYWDTELEQKCLPKVKRVFREVLTGAGVVMVSKADADLYGEETKSRYVISLKVLNLDIKEWGGTSVPSMIGEGTIQVMIYDTEQKKVIYENIKTTKIDKIRGKKEENIAALIETILLDLVNNGDLLDAISKL